MGRDRVEHLRNRLAGRQRLGELPGLLGELVGSSSIAPIPLERRSRRQCLCLALGVARGSEGSNRRLVQRHALVDRVELQGALFQQRSPPLDVGRRHRHGLLIELPAPAGIESPGSLGCLHEEAIGAPPAVGIIPGAQLDGRHEMVGQQLGDVGHSIAGHRLQPAGRRLVESSALVARETAVRHVSHQHVGECVFVLTLHRRTAHRADQLPPYEPPQALLEIGRRRHERQRSNPEHLADHRSRLQHSRVFGVEQIEPRSDDRLNRVGERKRLAAPGTLEPAALSGQGHVLGHIQGIPAASLQERLLRLGRHHHPPAERCHQRPSVVGVEG